MVTTAISIFNPFTSSFIVALGPTVDDPNSIGACLVTNYADLNLATNLVSSGNISILGNTAAESTFNGPAVMYDSVDREESQMDVSDYNFILFVEADGNKWRKRVKGVPGYSRV